MKFEAWQLAMMEDMGWLDTSTSIINRVARYLIAQGDSEVDEVLFRRACDACGADADSFTADDLEQLQQTLDRLA
jgi:hypothetical protein